MLEKTEADKEGVVVLEKTEGDNEGDREGDVVPEHTEGDVADDTKDDGEIRRALIAEHVEGLS